MSRTSKTLVMLGTGALLLGTSALAACASDRGPGAIGTRDDIVVHSNGLPAAHDGNKPEAAAQPAAPAAADASTGSAIPNNSPAMQQAVAAHDAARAPLSSVVDTPARPSALSSPMDTVAPAVPVTQSASPPVSAAASRVPDASAAGTPSSVSTATGTTAAPVADPDPVPAPSETLSAAPVPMPAPDDMTASAPAAEAAHAPEPIKPSGVYPAADYAGRPTAPPSAAAPAAAAPAATAPVFQTEPSAPPSAPYHMADPNAPYSPRSAAAASASPPAAAAAAPNATPYTLNMTDPSVVRSAQKALAARAGYNGPASGMVDANFLSALSGYQVQHKLPQGGLNQETLRSLGVIE